jgi:hypothetical protein
MKPLSRRKRVVFMALSSLLAVLGCFLLIEVSFRLFSNQRYWIRSDRWLIGSGQTEAGKKWWPDTSYTVESVEFRLEFRTNAAGYRARPQPVRSPDPYRIAFVGDSFTEGMQVSYDATFCARMERLLNQAEPERPFVCENFGVAATDLFDYWHRIIHDVLPANPPDALVLCIYPGNDFQCFFPDDGFDAEGRPLRDYFHKPAWSKHLVAWINLHSKFGSFLQRSLLTTFNVKALVASQGPRNWWTDPDVAAGAANAPALRRARSVLLAIDEECRRSGTKLCILVVGPVVNYQAKNGQSPLSQILAQWHIDLPMIDVAIEARALPDWASLVFPCDGHLNQRGHDYLANQAAPRLQAILARTELTAAGQDHSPGPASGRTRSGSKGGSDSARSGL